MPELSGTSVRWVEDLDSLLALAPEWERLERRSRSELASLSGPGFLLPWYRNAGRQGHASLVGALYDAGELVGVAPLVRWRGSLGRVPLRRVDLAGHSAEAGGLLFTEGGSDPLRSLFSALLRDYRPDLVVLTSSADPFGDSTAIEGAARSRGLAVEPAPLRHARADLSGGYDAYAARKGRHFRRVVKSTAAKAAGAGKPRLEIRHRSLGREEAERLAERLAAMVDRNRAASGQGPMPGAEREFRRDLLVSLGERDQALVAVLSVGGWDAAYLVASCRGAICADLYIGYDHAMADLSPGTLLRHELMQRLPDLGVETVVSPGDYAYKARWATEFVERERLYCFVRTPHGRLARLTRFVLPRVLARARRLRLSTRAR